MTKDCEACMSKYILCTCNFLFFILGSLVLACGIWIDVDRASFISATKLVEEDSDLAAQLNQLTQPNVIQQAAYIMMACGGFIFIISVLGYCGALRESRGLLGAYAILLMIILALELTAGGLVFAYKEKAEEKTKEIFKDSIKKYYKSPDKTDALTLFWNHMMIQLECCGVDGYQDFADSPFKEGSSDTVPVACCVMENKGTFKPLDPGCTKSPSASNSYYERGCYQAFVDLLLNNANTAIFVGIGLGLAQILALLIALVLCNAIGNYEKC